MRWGKVPTVPSSKDYYEILGVDRDADQRTIKRAFLKKAREVHPDVSDDPDAEQKFKEVNEAYSVLSDEQKRANYDRFGTPDGPGGSGYVDFSDIFGGMGMDDIFSSFFGGGGRSGRGGSRMIAWPPARIVRAPGFPTAPRRRPARAAMAPAM